MTEIDHDPGEAPQSQTAPGYLVLRCGQHRFVLDRERGEVTLGRGTACDVHLDYKWLSRTHLRLAPSAGQWIATDTSRNGIFVDGQKVATTPVSAGTVIHLGDAEGVAVTFHDPADDAGADAEAPADTEFTDPGILRAGRAVAERRKALGIAQRQMASTGVLNAGALVSFEKGRSWPQERTLTKLEQALQWPSGAIAAIRRGEVQPEETTQVVSTTVATPLITQSIQLALHGIDAAVSALPPVSSPEFSTRAAAILADLRVLQTMVGNAAQSSPGVAGLVVALGTVRRRYDEVMTLAASAGSATLGQRLYAARRRSNLTRQDAAHATGLPVELIAAAEDDQPVSPHAQSAVELLLRQLS